MRALIGNGSYAAMRGAVELTLALAAVPGTHALRPYHRCTAFFLPSCTKSTSRPHCFLRSPSRCSGLHSERWQRSSTFSRLMSRWAGTDGPETTTSSRCAMVFDGQPVSTSLDQPQPKRPERARSSKQQQQQSWARVRREAQFNEEGEYRVYRDLLDGRKTRFVSRVMYDGTNYRGFQLQNNGQPTIQVRAGPFGGTLLESRNSGTGPLPVFVNRSVCLQSYVYSHITRHSIRYAIYAQSSSVVGTISVRSCRVWPPHRIMYYVRRPSSLRLQ